ncbi:MAG: LysR family transcriptional regulator, partial [Clostridia bacterium]|nr:LysR family transcriptional regulator [Clostridia bacterium]
MELLQLKYFTEAAKNENLSATAKKFMVPPSAVSQSIKRLEKEMGCDLFIRQANRIHLSPKGRIFYEKVSKGLQLLNDAKEELTDEGTHGTVKLSIFINRRLVMQTVEKFSRQYPEINIVTKYTAAPTED